MAKGKIKPLMPTLREKKRYLVYEVISKSRFNDAVHVNKAILDASKEFLGNLGMAKAGILPLDDQWSQNIQRGVIRVSNKHVDNAKAAFVFVKSIGNHEAIVRSVGASGVLKRAKQKYFNAAQ
ncbi:MAG: Rpp14/Pop5 family protein [Nanoarchaeota archaeon]